MSFLGKISPLISPLARTLYSNVSTRYISISAVNRVKEINANTEGATLTVSGVPVEHPKSDLLIRGTLDTAKNVCTKDGNSIFCPECSLGLEIKHTDVLILRQYVRTDGCMLPRRITGLCKRQQKRIGTMVTMAQKAGLMPNIAPANSKRDPTRRFEWKKYNKYYDERTMNY